MWDDRTGAIDAQIDAVAREMTAGGARADFTARLVRRIAAPRRERPSHVGWVGALAAAAAVVFAVFIAAPRKGPTPPLASISTAPQFEPLLMAAIGPKPIATTAAKAQVPRRTVRSTPPTFGIDGLAPLRLTPLAVARLDTPAIVVDEAAPLDRLDLTPIIVVPLTPQGEK